MQTGLERPERVGNPVLGRFLNKRFRYSLLSALIFHYIALAVLCVVIWPLVTGDGNLNYDVLLKLAGTYCFLIATIAVPMISPILFPPIGESDNAFDLTPVEPSTVFDARMYATLILSACVALPLLPLFLISDPLFGRPFDGFDVLPFFLSITTAAWVHLVMEIVGASERADGRLSVVAAFILLHIGLVGIMAGRYMFFLQRHQIYKLLLDVNPFSQLYILMEGPDQKWLLINSDFQKFMDFRLYMILIQGIILAAVWIAYRLLLRARESQ